MLRRWRRWLVVLVVAVAVAGVVRYYLSSHFVAARVAAKLGELYGGRLEVGSADVGVQHTILRDVKLFEPGDNKQPWLTVDHLEADISLADVLAGAMPSRVELDGVAVYLRFDAKGRLQTQLPPRSAKASPSLSQAGLPEIVVTNGKVLLVGTGLRRMDFDNVAVTLKPDNNRHILEGRGHSASCGEVSATGWIDIKDAQVSVTAHSNDDVAVKQGLLETLPFVPAATWREVQADGITPVLVTWTCDWAKAQQNYRVELKPRNTNVHVEAIDLSGSGLAGFVEIANDRLKLREVKGLACGGKLAFDGDLDFTQPGVGVNLTTLVVDDADVRQLPARWSLPPQLQGRLFAACNIQLQAAAGKVLALGTGTGEVRHGAVGGLQIAEPVRLVLQDLGGATHLGARFEIPPSPLSLWAGTFGIKPPTESAADIAASVHLLLPLSTINNWATYRGDGRVDVTAGSLAGVALEPLTAALVFAGGEVKCQEFQARLKTGGSCLASGTVRFQEPFAFRAHLVPVGIDLAGLQKLEPSLRPSVTVAGTLDATMDISGTLAPFDLSTEGSGMLHAMQMGDIAVKSAKLQWRAAPGVSRPPDGVRPLEVDLQLRDADLTLDKVSATDVAGMLRIREGLFNYDVEGRTLDGKFGFKGQTALASAAANTPPKDGQLWLRGVALARLCELENAGPLAGTVDGDFTLHQVGNEVWPAAKGRIKVTDFSWKDHVLASQVLGNVSLDRQELTVTNVAATIARGDVSGKLVVNLKEPDRSWFNLDLASAELTELLSPWPELAEHAQGTTDLRVRGKIGKEWSGTLDAVLHRGKILGVDVTEWRAPITWTLRPGEGRAELVLRDSNAQIAQGRATGQATASWHDGLTLNGQVQFVGVDLGQAFPGYKVGNGKATGRIDFSSERLLTVDDLNATLIATMERTQALEFPVLRQVAPLLGMTTTRAFQQGELRARLAKSVVNIEKLTLSEGPIQLFAEGNVTLQGNVHLDMTANSGKIGNVDSVLGWKLPQAVTIARDMLVKATNALSPNLVHVHVRGNVREPTIQVVPLPLLTEQALRFFAR